MNELILEGPSLREGDWIEVVIADRSRGSPGAEIQPMDESAFPQPGNAGYGVRRMDATRGRDGALFPRFSPAERRTALLAVQAKALTRESVFQGIYRRRTYATTGERIGLRFDAEGAPDGSYYYLDLIQADGEKAISSPVWVN